MLRKIIDSVPKGVRESNRFVSYSWKCDFTFAMLKVAINKPFIMTLKSSKKTGYVGETSENQLTNAL